MSKPEWGAKRLCPHCGARFYDFKQETVVCPKCETTVTVAKPVGRKRVKVKAEVETPKVEVKAADTGEADDDILNVDLPDDDEDDDSDSDTDDSLMEDVSDLGGGDDDVAEVLEHVEASGDSKE